MTENLIPKELAPTLQAKFNVPMGYNQGQHSKAKPVGENIPLVSNNLFTGEGF